MAALISRKEAKARGLARYFTGVACRHGHIAERLVSNWVCMVCACEKAHRQYVTDPEGREAKKAADQKRRAYFERYRKQHRDRYINHAVQWREKNQDHAKALAKEWKAANKDKISASEARRHATKRNATPAWSEREAIEAIYALCQFMTTSTGVLHHVDHIVPLRGKTVCGLHVAANLQVIPATVNLSKNNRVWPDMPEEVGQ